MAAKKIGWRWLAVAAIAAVAIYFGLAYLLAPFFWRHFEHQPELAGFDTTTRTALGFRATRSMSGSKALRTTCSAPCTRPGGRLQTLSR